MSDHVIFHYEDEPQKVDFPGKIETALFQHPDVEKSRIEEHGVEQQEFTVTYRIAGADNTIRYIIDDSIGGAEERAGLKAEDVALHLVDRSIQNDQVRGIAIVEELLARQVPKERIWMVTAYENLARQDLRLKGVAVFPKPSPLAVMIDAMLKIVFESRG